MRGRKIAFRVDASLEIGTGHLMRCLTLADALRGAGHECHFICRAHAGHQIDRIEEAGFEVHRLPEQGIDSSLGLRKSSLQYEHWLGETWQEDARQTAEYLQQIEPAWLVVDHYALDKRWEDRVRAAAGRVLVIDDLADREHNADLLLDQNLGRQLEDYAGLVPEGCRLLIGPEFALLRPEFAKYRGQSLSRREYPELKRILISMGGVDKDNVTGRVLTKIAQELLPLDLEVEVVLGAVSPHIESVLEQAGRMTCPMNINVDVSDIARRMADSDLAIAATGSSSWERCCLGLPSIAIITAANQVGAGRSLDQAGAVRLLFMSDIETELIGMFRDFMANGDRLTAMTKAASGICDGLGADRVAHALRSSI